MISTEDGIRIAVSFPNANANSSIRFKFDFPSNFTNRGPSHAAKQNLQIISTEEGITIDSEPPKHRRMETSEASIKRESQTRNKLSPCETIIESRERPENAELSRNCSEFGITIDVN
jgi:hypothetical protein